MCSKSHQFAQLTRNLHGEYASIPLNIVCAVIHHLLFLYKNKYFYNFYYTILAKYSPKRTKLHHFFKFSWGRMSPNPLGNTPTFAKIFRTPHRNEILDTPLEVLYARTHMSDLNIRLHKMWVTNEGNSGSEFMLDGNCVRVHV